MSNAKHLTKRQLAVLEDLFAGDANEEQILEKHKVKSRVYNKWLTDESFISEFERRLDAARRQNDLIIARFASIAAGKLIQLTESTNPETARKACLDIITLLHPATKQSEPPPDDNSDAPAELPPELAGKLLAAIAGNERSDTSGAKEGRHSSL